MRTRIQPGTVVVGKFGKDMKSKNGRLYRLPCLGEVLHGTKKDEYKVCFLVDGRTVVVIAHKNALKIQKNTASPFAPRDESSEEDDDDGDIAPDSQSTALSSPDLDDDGDVNMEEDEEEAPQVATAPEVVRPDQSQVSLDQSQIATAPEVVVHPDYATRLAAARAKVRGFLGNTVVKESGNDRMEWKVVEEHKCAPDGDQDLDDSKIGLKPEVLSELDPDDPYVLAKLFLRLLYKNWQLKLASMN